MELPFELNREAPSSPRRYVGAKLHRPSNKDLVDRHVEGSDNPASSEEGLWERLEYLDLRLDSYYGQLRSGSEGSRQSGEAKEVQDGWESSPADEDRSSLPPTYSIRRPGHVTPPFEESNRKTRTLPGEDMQLPGSESRTQEVQLQFLGMKRVFPAQITPEPTGRPTSPPTTPAKIDACSALHHTCRLFPTTKSIIECALSTDPNGIRRPVPTACTDFSKEPSDSRSSSSKRKQMYSYPLNIAMIHMASMDVIKVLIGAGRDVIPKKDGPLDCCALSTALRLKQPPKVLLLLLYGNSTCARVKDRHHNYPLHIACETGAPLTIVEHIYNSYPQAALERNFHGDTPFAISCRNQRCPKEVNHFLHEIQFGGCDDFDDQGLEDGLDDIAC